MSLLDLPEVFKTDAAESAFVNRELEHVSSKVYETEYPDLVARTLLPINSEGAGADLLSYESTDSYGSAKIISDFGADLPRADVSGKMDSQRVRTLGSSYGYSVGEMRAAARVGKNLEQRKANAARRVCEELLDDIAFFGDSKYDLKGFANHPNLTVGTAAQSFAAATPDQLHELITGMVGFISDATKGKRKPDSLALPEAQWTKIATKRLTDSNETVLSFLLRVQPWIKRIVPAYKLKGAGAAGADRMIAYSYDPEIITLEIPSEFETLPAERKGLEWVTACMLTTGGVVVRNANAFYALDGI